MLYSGKKMLLFLSFDDVVSYFSSGCLIPTRFLLLGSALSDRRKVAISSTGQQHWAGDELADLYRQLIFVHPQSRNSESLTFWRGRKMEGGLFCGLTQLNTCHPELTQAHSWNITLLRNSWEFLQLLSTESPCSWQLTVESRPNRGQCETALKTPCQNRQVKISEGTEVFFIHKDVGTYPLASKIKNVMSELCKHSAFSRQMRRLFAWQFPARTDVHSAWNYARTQTFNEYFLAWIDCLFPSLFATYFCEHIIDQTEKHGVLRGRQYWIRTAGSPWVLLMRSITMSLFLRRESMFKWNVCSVSWQRKLIGSVFYLFDTPS